jgi:hypothetical protein
LSLQISAFIYIYCTTYTRIGESRGIEMRKTKQE